MFRYSKPSSLVLLALVACGAALAEENSNKPGEPTTDIPLTLTNRGRDQLAAMLKEHLLKTSPLNSWLRPRIIGTIRRTFCPSRASS
jgi:hypothetical protein